MTETTLESPVLADVEELLSETDSLLARSFPGDDGSRQPVHTVYVPADHFTPNLASAWGARALEAVADFGGIAEICRLLGVTGRTAEEVGSRVIQKLQREPVEDLRIDFEDGYGTRGDDVEDAEALRSAQTLRDALGAGTAPPFVGIRFKNFEAETRARGIRTLDLFLTALLRSGPLPSGLMLTLPKVTTTAQVEAMVRLLSAFEKAHGLPDGRLGFEVQVETPQLVLGADGTVPLSRLPQLAAGRITGLHYGTYDYSASLGIAAQHQSMEHPAADLAKGIMQLAVAGTGIRLSDGSTNVLPVEGQLADAWSLHGRLIQRSLERGFYQGWDLHPAQLVTRYVATYAFYRSGLDRATSRLSSYRTGSQAGILDEPATARALADFVVRGLRCGAVDELDVSAAGLDPAWLASLA